MIKKYNKNAKSTIKSTVFNETFQIMCQILTNTTWQRIEDRNFIYSKYQPAIRRYFFGARERKRAQVGGRVGGFLLLFSSLPAQPPTFHPKEKNERLIDGKLSKYQTIDACCFGFIFLDLLSYFVIQFLLYCIRITP